MREDMDKLIVERPRQGSRQRNDDPKGYSKRIVGRGADWEELPFRESMSGGRRKHGWDKKELNENLSPLLRFLESNVGRPWDKVYSEIRKQINANSAVQLHILQHLFDFVQVNTFIGPDGKAWEKSAGWRRGHRPVTEMTHPYLYVHPTNNLLCRIKEKEGRRKRKARLAAEKAAKADFVIADRKWFRRQNGIWYILQMSYIPEGPFGHKVEMYNSQGESSGVFIESPTSVGAIRDVYLDYSLYYLCRGSHRTILLDHYRRDDIYCAACKQASTSELKRAGLKNDKEKEYVNARPIPNQRKSR